MIEFRLNLLQLDLKEKEREKYFSITKSYKGHIISKKVSHVLAIMHKSM